MRRRRPRILVAFDFSEAAEAALTEAMRFARATRAELVILHVFAERNNPAEYGWKGGAVQREHERLELLRLLQREAEDARSVQVLARVRTAAGDPGERILEAATLERVSGIYLGADAHDGVVGALLGRVAIRVVREAKVPVFVVRRRASASPTDVFPRRRIVVGFDFTSASIAALDAAIDTAKNSGGGDLRIVHVIPSAHSANAEEMARLRSRLEEIATDVSANGVVATAYLAFGDPATALMAETEREPGSIIAVGVHTRSRLSMLLIGDTTESVLRLTDATVVVAHAESVSMPLVALPIVGAPNEAARQKAGRP